jgi:hypothetical protein
MCGKSLSLLKLWFFQNLSYFLKRRTILKIREEVFDLSVKYEELSAELRQATMIQSHQLRSFKLYPYCCEKDCTRKTILKLDKMALSNIWDEAEGTIKSSIDFSELTELLLVVL